MKKRSFIVLVFLLIIGFASVSTTLILNGEIGIASNQDDFNIIFTSARLNNKNRNDFIDETKKVINFETDKLITVNDVAILDYDVTNTSRLYDGEVVIECAAAEDDNGYSDYLVLEYEPKSMHINAGKTESGSITAKLIKSSTEDQSVSIMCTLKATPVERDTLGEEYAEPFTVAGTLKATTASNTSDFWGYKSKITKIVFENEITEKEDAEYTFDVSVDSDKPVMSYLVPSDEYQGYYTLYIASKSGVYANPDSSYLFSGFSNLLSIEGMRYFDTSNVTNMSNMFSYCENLVILDLSNFNTSNVTNMSYMFNTCKNATVIDVSSFDTSKVTDMTAMFFSLGTLANLDLSSFDTSNVTNMMMMFSSCNNLVALDLSNFNTSNVTNMMMMFTGCRSLTKLDVSNFDTTKVTAMNGMFMVCSSLVELDLSSFDTRNVSGMGQMFQECSSLKYLNISKFDFSSLTSYPCIFNLMADEAKIIVKDATIQSKILAMNAGSSVERPEAWTTENVIIAS